MIDGKEYDTIHSMQKPSLSILKEMLVKTGMGMKTLAERADKLNGITPIDILDDAEHLETLMVLVWLARRVAGEVLTLEEANDFPLDSMLRVVDDKPEEEAPDPKAQAGSAPAAKPLPKTGTSRTSKPRSTKTSSP
jgi:hypothetical protein